VRLAYVTGLSTDIVVIHLLSSKDDMM